MFSLHTLLMRIERPKSRRELHFRNLAFREHILMGDQALAVEAVTEAQRIIEEYLEPRYHDLENLLDKLVEVLERPSVLVAVERLRRSGF